MSQLEDGAMRICSAEEGFKHCCTITPSMHLVSSAQNRIAARMLAEGYIVPPEGNTNG
jgi:hypothetical protein